MHGGLGAAGWQGCGAGRAAGLPGLPGLPGLASWQDHE